MEFTRTLTEIGFATVGSTMSGHQHRWIRGDACIDILIGQGLGQRGSRRRGATGATTLTSPGMQQALDRTETVDIQIAAVRGGSRGRPCTARSW